MAEFAVSHDKEKLVMQQSRYCMQAAEFFDRSDQVSDPAYLGDKIKRQLHKERCTLVYSTVSGVVCL